MNEARITALLASVSANVWFASSHQPIGAALGVFWLIFAALMLYNSTAEKDAT